MRQTLTSLWQWFRGAALVAGGALLGWFGNQYMDYRSAYKEALGANYAQFDTAAGEVEQSLKSFADVARGAKLKSDEDVTQLQLRLLKAVGVAEDLQRRLGSNGGAVEQYKLATVELKHASDKVTGPVDAKPLVIAVSDYLVAEKSIRDTVVKENNAFLY